MGRLARVVGIVGTALRQLRYYRTWTVLAVMGVTLGVLLITLLGGLGYGLTTTGDEAIDYLDRELWMSGGAVRLAPGSPGGIESPMTDAHELAERIERQPGVRRAEALRFQSVYVSENGSRFDTVVGVGITGDASSIGVNGPGFSGGGSHYANGSYDGPLTREIIVGPQVARRYDLSVGDQLYIGGTVAAAQEHTFTVVGVSGTFSRFLAAPTVTLRLSELQTVSGTTGEDRAALIAISTEPGTSTEAVRDRLERAFPGYEVRTNDQQVRAIIGDQSAVIASAVTVSVLAVVVGTVLLVNVLGLLVYYQREQLAALNAAGVSARSLVGIVVVQGVIIGVVGGAVAVGLTPPLVALLNAVALDISGFPSLAKTPPWLLGGALGLAVLMGLVGATVAGWRVTRLSPVALLGR